MRALKFLLRKEFLQLTRDKMLVRMIFVLPVAQLLLLANTATFEVKRSRMFVVDKDRSSISRGLIDRLVASGRFVPQMSSPSVKVADEAMLHRDIDMILVIPEGFERDVVRTRESTVQVIMNAEDGAAAGVTQSYAAQIFNKYAGELTTTVSHRPFALNAIYQMRPVHGASIIEVVRRGWFNTRLKYRDYMVPGILVALITLTGTLLTAMNIVREKETGTLDQLNVTPVTRGIFIAAKLIPLWCFALLNLAIGVIVARLVFHLPMKGSLVLVFVSAAIYLTGALGIGLWVSSIVETQQQAMFVSFTIMMIYLLMSGLFTPVSAMPHWAQVVTQVNPLTHFIALVRAVLLKGAKLSDVADQVAWLAGIGVSVLTLSVMRYSKRAS
jgi:ABC-2 type transport system permease protein